MRSLGRSFALWLERSSLGSGFGGYKYRVRFTSSMYIFISKSSRIGSSALLPSACGPEVNDADEEELDVLEELDELDEEAFLSEVTRVITTKCVVIFVLGSLELLTLLIVCVLTCRREKDVATFRAEKSNIGTTVKV